MQVHQLFKEAMDRYRVSSKELAALAGISPNHLSQFRSGSKWVSPEVFIALLEGMDRISPGSRRYFCELLAQEPLSESEKEEDNSSQLQELIENANDDEVEAILLAIGKKWKKSRQNQTIYSNYSEVLDSPVAV